MRAILKISLPQKVKNGQKLTPENELFKMAARAEKDYLNGKTKKLKSLLVLFR